MRHLSAFVALLLVAVLGVVLSRQPIAALQANSSGVIEGNVLDEGGPVADAEVSAWGPAAASAMTNAKGHYVLDGIKPGTYFILPQKAGYPVGDIRNNSRQLNVSAGMRITSIDFKIARESIISGHVVDAEKIPIGGALVTAYVKKIVGGRFSAEVRGSGITNAQGEYHIAGLRAGKYYIRGSSSQVRFFRGTLTKAKGESQPVLASIRTYYPNAATLDAASTIYLGSSEQRERLELVLNEDFTVCANGIVAEDPTGLRGSISLKVEEVDSFWLASVVTGNLRSGERFEVCGLPPGSYDIWLAVTNSNNPTAITGFISKEFTIGKHDVTLGILYPEPPVPLRGKVTIAEKSEKDSVPAGIILRLRFLNRPNGIGNESTVAFVASSGDFIFPGLFSDSFGLDVQGLPRGFYVKEAIQDGRDVRRSPIQSHGSDLLVQVSTEGPIISGNTVDLGGQPVADAMVVFSSRDQSGTDLRTVVTSDQNGRFEVSGLSPGRYSVLCITGLVDGEEPAADFVRSPLSGATELVVEARQSTEIKLVAHPAHAHSL